MQNLILALAAALVIAGYTHSQLPADTTQQAVSDITTVSQVVRPLQAFQTIADVLNK